MPYREDPGHRVEHHEVLRLYLCDGKHEAVVVHAGGSNYDLYVVRKNLRTEGAVPLSHILHLKEGSAIEISESGPRALCVDCICETVVEHALHKSGFRVEIGTAG